MALPARAPGWGITRSDIFNELEEMRKNMQEVFGSRSWGSRFPALHLLEQETWTPSVDMFEQGNELVIRVDLPGIDPKDVRVTMENDVLTIEGERKHEKEIKEENFYRREATFGKFLRRMGLQPGLKPEDMKASYKKGVLEVRLPRAKTSAAKQSPIET
jgi:HSP20 family protein